jgi:hypothetical protein
MTRASFHAHFNPTEPAYFIAKQHVCLPHVSSYRSRRHFVVFVKILMKTLKLQNETVLLHRAKQVIRECVLLNRMGDERASPLRDAVARNLRQTVGPDYYLGAHIQYARCCQRAHIEPVNAA